MVVIYRMHRALEAFSSSNAPDSAIIYYASITSGAAIAKDVIYVTTVLIADSFLTYRLFVVWDRTWWITILPILMVLGTAAAGYGACGDLATFSLPASSSIFAGPPTLTPFIGTLFSLPVATNLLLTALIAGRIIWSLNRTRKHDALLVTNWHWDVLETVVQSALISSTGLVALLGTYVAASNAQYICMDAVQPLIGINYTLIILRVHYRRGSEDEAPHSGARTRRRASIGVRLPGSMSRSTQDFDGSASDPTLPEDEWCPKGMMVDAR